MPFADLHTHSTFSDGVKTPEEMLKLAQGEVAFLAITDHDCLEGARQAISLNTSEELSLVPGVELSTKFNGRDVHMLGYFLDLGFPQLDGILAQNRAVREKRACAMADRMAQDGYDVSAELLVSSGETINRGLLARLLVKRSIAQSVDEAFEHYLGFTSKYYVDVAYMDTVEAMRLIHEAHGYSFIAHPAHYGVVDCIRPLKDEGLNGLEAFHTLHSPQESAALVQLADELGLAVSGGSDWHGDATHGACLGSAGLDEEGLVRFLGSCNRA